MKALLFCQEGGEGRKINCVIFHKLLQETFSKISKA